MTAPAAAPAYDGFHGGALVALVAAGAVAVAWLALLAVSWFRRVPRRPRQGPETSELGPEPPAVANLLVNAWYVTAPAVPATLVDLAARGFVALEEVGPERFVVRTRATKPDAPLTAYEQQVLRLVESRATGGSAPVEVLHLGEHESSGWLARFSGAVVKDAERLKLADRGWSRREQVVLGVTLAVALGLVGLAFELAHVGTTNASHDSRDPGGWFAVAAVAWIVAVMATRRVHAVRATHAGRAACSRWLGVRAHLRRDESFVDQPPAAVTIWGRTLAYGVALGVNRAAALALPIGPDDPEHAWSRERGSWRELRVRYARRFGAGEAPGHVLANGILRLVVWGAIGFVGLPIVIELLWNAAHDLTDGRSNLTELAVVVAFLAVPTAAAIYVCARIVDGAVRTWRGAYDLRHVTTVTGPVVKVHDGWFAVDDGHSSTLEAMHPEASAPPELGRRVAVRVTPKLHHVVAVDPVRDDDRGVAETGSAQGSA